MGKRMFELMDKARPETIFALGDLIKAASKEVDTLLPCTGHSGMEKETYQLLFTTKMLGSIEAILELDVVISSEQSERLIQNAVRDSLPGED